VTLEPLTTLGFFTKMSQAAAEALTPVQNGSQQHRSKRDAGGIASARHYRYRSACPKKACLYSGLMQDTRDYYAYHHSAADTLR